MKTLSIVLGLMVVMYCEVQGQHTFSIVAIDTVTKEIGSAGATCLQDRNNPLLGGARIISDILPGVGAVNTQSYWTKINQNTARQRLQAGDNAHEIIEFLENNDASGNKSIRQYGAAVLDPAGKPTAEAFTGENCFDYKGHVSGTYYAIQGNILLGKQVIDSMHARFLNNQGSLAEKLMACLQGANIAGADSRCLNEGVSSQSAFIRVAKEDDEEGDLFLDLNVSWTPFGEEPIDSLQTLFDDWRTRLNNHNLNELQLTISPNPVAGSYLTIVENSRLINLSWSVVDLKGRHLISGALSGKAEIDVSSLVAGPYFLQVRKENQVIAQYKLIRE